MAGGHGYPGFPPATGTTGALPQLKPHPGLPRATHRWRVHAPQPQLAHVGGRGQGQRAGEHLQWHCGTMLRRALYVYQSNTGLCMCREAAVDGGRRARECDRHGLQIGGKVS